MAEVLILTDKDVEELISFNETIAAVEKAFADFQQGRSEVFPVVREEIIKHKGIFGVKSGYLQEDEVLGFKAGGFWLGNMDKGLANHQSTMMLFDPFTGQPQALIAANYITKIRTAALGAIGCKYLADRKSKVVTVIGAGLQGKNQLLASLQVLSEVELVQVYDARGELAVKMADEFSSTRGVKITAISDPKAACSNAQVIITATPSYKFIVEAGWVKPGTHLNCIGSDTKGKQEIDPRIFLNAKIVVDNIQQCITIGETQHAFNQGLIQREDIYAEIGELILGSKDGRVNSQEITIFDTTGVTIQDLVTAGKVLDKAIKSGKGQKAIV